METPSIGTDSTQSRILDQVSVTMLSKGLKSEQEQADDLLKTLDSATQLPEGSGVSIDLLA